MSAAARYSFIFLFLLSLVLAAGNYLLSASAVHKAQASAASTVQLCQAGNESRAEQVRLWAYLIAISPPPPHETPAQRAQRVKTIQAFTGYVHQVFAPRNCQEKGQLWPP